LVFDRRDQPPISVLPAKLNPVVPILDRNPFQLLAVEIDDVTGFTLGLCCTWFLAFEKLDPSAESDGEHKKDERCPRVHSRKIVRRAAATRQSNPEVPAPAASGPE